MRAWPPQRGADSAAPALTEEEWVARFVTEFDAEEIVPEAPAGGDR